MPPSPITHFDPDPERFAVLRECTANYDVGDTTAEWPNNILSRRMVVYGSGQIARQGDVVRHAVDPRELALCRRLSAQIARRMAGVSVGMGSEAGDEFHDFFIVGQVGARVPAKIAPALIRRRFAGTIFPPAGVSVEPLAEGTRWWRQVELDGRESGMAYFRPWRAMVRWFKGRVEFVDTAFVQIGNRGALEKVPDDKYPPGTHMFGCVLPRLALGLTAGGSLVGLFGYVVHT